MKSFGERISPFIYKKNSKNKCLLGPNWKHKCVNWANYKKVKNDRNRQLKNIPLKHHVSETQHKYSLNLGKGQLLGDPVWERA